MLDSVYDFSLSFKIDLYFKLSLGTIAYVFRGLDTMIHPSQFLNQRIKGYYCPIELIKRSAAAFTFKAVDERNNQEVVLKIFSLLASSRFLVLLLIDQYL